MRHQVQATHALLAAFHARRAAEKTLTSLLVATSGDRERTHTRGRLARELRSMDATIPEWIERNASALDLLYLTARDPDTIGDEDPSDVISSDDATHAVARATPVLEFVRARLTKDVGG